jgi:hypothetical protein
MNAKRALVAVLLAAVAGGGIVASRFLGPEGAADSQQRQSRPPADRAAAPGAVTHRPVRVCDTPTLIGTVKTPKIAARVAPRPSARVVATFRRLNEIGAPQVFDLMKRVDTADHGVWFRALLPIRPNGTTGYVRASALQLATTTYRLTISRSSFTLTLWEGCRRLKAFPIGIGTGKTPTPVGHFYLIALLKPPDPDSIYGPYAYGLSAFSDVIRDWRGGGIIGLHGTNDPSSIGKRSSHGCIRMRNRDIEALAKILPLGTPVEIN